MKILGLLVLLTLSTTLAMEQAGSMEERCKMFKEVSSAILLSPGICFTVVDDVTAGDVLKCYMHYTNICELDYSNTKIMNLSFSAIPDLICKGIIWYNTTFKGYGIVCCVTMMPRRLYDPYRVLDVGLPCFKDYDKCDIIFRMMKEAVEQNASYGRDVDLLEYDGVATAVETTTWPNGLRPITTDECSALNVKLLVSIALIIFIVIVIIVYLVLWNYKRPEILEEELLIALI